jgi:putative nucleotidyltransferase with HDIG domain
MMISLLNKKNKNNQKPEAREADLKAEELNIRLDLLYDVALKASSFSEISKLTEQILSITQSIVNCSASSLLLVDEAKGKMHFQASEGPAGNKLTKNDVDIDSGIAGWVARHKKPLLVNDAYKDKRFNKDIDKSTDFITKSVIAVPLIRGQKTIGVLEVLNKNDASEFNEKDLAILTGFASTEALILLVSMTHTAISNITVHETYLKGYTKTARTLAQAADDKDAYAVGHSERVKDYTMLAANSLSFSPDELQTIEFGALLHDIGKIGIDKNILCKPGPLTDSEWEIMRKHPVIGAKIVGDIPFIEKTKDIILHHHERYDGKGYPKRLKKENIPIGARLVAVADAFDTMTTEHSYRPALTVDKAIEELIAGRGTQFCPMSVDTFVSAFKRENASLLEKEPEHPVPEKTDSQADKAKKTKKTKKAHKDKSETDSELLTGDVQLNLPTVASSKQVQYFKESLKRIDNLQISVAAWSDEGGHEITVSLTEPKPLMAILKKMPIVEDVQKNRGKITVTLKMDTMSSVL